VTRTSKRKLTSAERGIREGYRSGLEVQVASQLRSAGVDAKYEDPDSRIEYRVEETRKYTPDFVLDNGIIIETKGRFTSDDRKKHRLIREQHPDKDIRFVFSNSRQRISKISTTTYGMWCDKYGIKYADKLIPTPWLKEPKK
jgi:hypothetical protein